MSTSIIILVSCHHYIDQVCDCHGQLDFFCCLPLNTENAFISCVLLDSIEKLKMKVSIMFRSV